VRRAGRTVVAPGAEFVMLAPYVIGIVAGWWVAAAAEFRFFVARRAHRSNG